jgi:formylglycine-generating enzyme required for sulfatase activity
MRVPDAAGSDPVAPPEHGCCAPARAGGGAHRAEGLSLSATPMTGASSGTASDRHTVPQCAVPAQVFAMGDAHGDGKWADGEGPVHEVTVAAYSIDATSVTNADFARFVADTGFRTEAETFGFSAVFHLVVSAPPEAVMGPAEGTPWWFGVYGADWQHPGGPDSDLAGLDDHPVVHVSWNDAQAYCSWAGRALPTEAQWECASRGGRAGRRYPWGDALDSPQHCNIWQGRFPVENTLDDGYLTTAPVHTFQPNDYGLWQTIGNVWEWCADWWDPRFYVTGPTQDPTGPARGQQRAMRGGSYLCHDSYCNRYRNAARSSNTPDSSMGNAGFRTVALAT